MSSPAKRIDPESVFSVQPCNANSRCVMISVNEVIVRTEHHGTLSSSYAISFHAVSTNT